MSDINHVEMRRFVFGSYRILALCVFVDNYASANVTANDMMECLEDFNGYTIDGYSAIRPDYSAYDTSISDIDVTVNSLRLVRTVSYNDDLHQLSSILIYKDSSIVGWASTSHGYVGGSDNAEFSPLVVFVDNDSNKLLTGIYSMRFCFNNNDNNLTIVSEGGTYRMLIDTTVPNYAANYCYSFSIVAVDIDDVSDIASLGGDPYEPGGTSGPGGGTGTLSDTGDIIGVPDLPTLSAVDTGFIQIFKPDLSQLRSLANVLWSDSFYTNFIKSFANPMDVILGLGIVPVDVPVEASPREVAAGNIGTGVNMYVASSQYVRVECGSLNIEEFWGAYLDYNPYTKLSIYLPYIGIKPLDIDAYMGKTITVTYHIDILTGACVAYILANGTQMATWSGQCMAQIPVNSQQYPNIVSGILGIATGAGALLLGGAGMAGIGAAAGANMLVQSNMMISGASGVLSSAANINKHTAEHSGNLGSTAGMMGVQTPYLILERPSLCIPSKQNTYMGYPSFITATLGDLEGYTEVSAIHLNNIPATEEELIEIERLLKEGVII